MSKVIGPSGGVASDLAAPVGVLALCWTPALVVGVVWTAGHAAAWLSGEGWTGPAFGFGFARSLAREGLGAQWPTASPTLLWTTTVIMAAGICAIVAVVARSVAGRRTDALDALAAEADVTALLPAGVERRARSLRPSLQTRPRRAVKPAECGVALGRLDRGRGTGPCVRASWEDVVLALMAPRAGKTTALAVPSILEAPGAVVATSNKSDLWAATSALREAETQGRVWVFDPQGIAYADQTWWWNPLRGVTTIEEAHRLAGHFIQEVRGERGQRDFWTSAAHDLLTSLLLAAALTARSLVDVYEWLNDPVIAAPADLLRSHGELAAAASLQGRQHGAPETRDGVYETARTAAQCLRDGQIMRWVSPPRGPLEELDASAFPLTRETIYLLSKDGAGAAAPLVAALTDRIMREATRAAERRGGRLDPPLLVVLDEAANVCRIADLPDLYSHLGSRGVVPLTILQSYRQGTRVWGELGMDALWSAATCKVIGAGLDDAKLAEDISRLVGDHDVTVRSVSRGNGHASQSTSLRRQRILGPEAIRALPRGSALLFATGCRPAMLQVAPWYDGPRAADVASAIATAEADVTRRASSFRPEALAAATEPR